MLNLPSIPNQIPRQFLQRLNPLYVAIALSVVMTAGLLLTIYRPASGGVDYFNRPIGQDFINVWVGPNLAFHGRLQALFDYRVYADAASQLFGRKLSPYSWSYPPHTLLLYFPFSCLPYFVALALWTVLGVTVWLFIYRLYAGKLDRVAVAVLCLSPAFAINVIDGQNGFFAAGLFIGGLLAMKRYPLLAGILFGILTFKPQLGIVLPFVLIALHEWKVIFYAVISFGVFVGISILVLGGEAWVKYFTVTSGWQLAVLMYTDCMAARMSIAPLTGFLVVGIPPSVAFPVQVIFSILLLGIVCQGIKRTEDLRERIFLLCCVVPLVSPYILDYDLCLLTIPLTYRLLNPAPGETPHRLIYVGAWLAPTLGLVLALTPFRFLQAIAQLFLISIFFVTIVDIDKRRVAAMELSPEMR